MFPINGPVCVSEDEGLFKVVMSTFYQHEQMVRERKKKALYGCTGELLKPIHCEPHLNTKACRLRAPQSTFSLTSCV